MDAYRTRHASASREEITSSLPNDDEEGTPIRWISEEEESDEDDDAVEDPGREGSGGRIVQEEQEEGRAAGHSSHEETADRLRAHAKEQPEIVSNKAVEREGGARAGREDHVQAVDQEDPKRTMTPE